MCLAFTGLSTDQRHSRLICCLNWTKWYFGCSGDIKAPALPVAGKIWVGQTNWQLRCLRLGDHQITAISCTALSVIHFCSRGVAEIQTRIIAMVYQVQDATLHLFQGMSCHSFYVSFLLGRLKVEAGKKLRPEDPTKFPDFNICLIKVSVDKMN